MSTVAGNKETPMFNQLKKYCRPAVTAPAVLLAVVSAFCLSQDAHAQTASFEFNISSSELFLSDGANYNLMHIEAWDSPLMRAIKRSRPFVEVRNTSTSGVQLTQFSMTIGDEDYSFGDSFLGDFAVLGDTTPNVNLTDVSGPDGGNELLIQFGDGGLDPGEVVRFQIDIDGDLPDQFIHPDYRTVLFDMGDDDNSDNSILTASFITGSGQMLEVQGVQPDTEEVSPYVNGNLRPYAVMEPIDGSGFEELVPIVPEPGAVALALLALCGACAAGMRTRLG